MDLYSINGPSFDVQLTALFLYLNFFGSLCFNHLTRNNFFFFFNSLLSKIIQLIFSLDTFALHNFDSIMFNKTNIYFFFCYFESFSFHSWIIFLVFSMTKNFSPFILFYLNENAFYSSFFCVWKLNKKIYVKCLCCYCHCYTHWELWEKFSSRLFNCFFASHYNAEARERMKNVENWENFENGKCIFSCHHTERAFFSSHTILFLSILNSHMFWICSVLKNFFTLNASLTVIYHNIINVCHSHAYVMLPWSNFLSFVVAWS